MEETGRRKRRNDECYKNNVIKKARIKGYEHINSKNKRIAPKTIGAPCGCHKDCFSKFNEDQMAGMFVNFYDFNSKQQQDIFLSGLIDVCAVKRRRSVKENSTRRVSNNYKYFVMNRDQRTEVCFKAFLSLYAVTKARINRIKKNKAQGLNPASFEKRQCATHVLPVTTRLLVKEHIESFPVKKSHYSGNEIDYLDARLNVSIMYKMFKQKHPNQKVSYSYYYNFFMEHFHLRFGRPQVDSCCTCEELTQKMKSSHSSDAIKRTAEIELKVHKQRSKKFYTTLNNDTTAADHILPLCIDYMQNIQLPQIPVQEIFYLRQLTLSIFCIHNIKDNNAKLYTYHEGIAKKGASEVCSFLMDYISDIPNTITELHLYADNCAGQNKNHSLLRFLLALCDLKRFKKIKVYFPVRGHSYLPCDRDFSIIKRKLKKQDRIYHPHQVTETIVTSSANHKFIVQEVQTGDITDFNKWWTSYYKKDVISEETQNRNTPRANKVRFTISQFSYFEMASDKPGCIVAKPFIGGLISHTFRLCVSGRPQPVLPTTPAYTGKIPIKKPKIKDLKKVLCYIDHDFLDFYNNIVDNWPTTDSDTD